MTGELWLLLGWVGALGFLILFLWACSPRRHNRYLDEDERADQLNKAWRKKKVEGM